MRIIAFAFRNGKRRHWVEGKKKLEKVRFAEPSREREGPGRKGLQFLTLLREGHGQDVCEKQGKKAGNKKLLKQEF